MTKEWYRVIDARGGCYHVQADSTEDAIRRAIRDGFCTKADEPVAEIPPSFGMAGMED